MLTQSIKQTRGKALEEAFFYRMDQELIELLRKSLQRDEKIRLFASATGIRDRKRLESTPSLNFAPAATFRRHHQVTEPFYFQKKIHLVLQ